MGTTSTQVSTRTEGEHQESGLGGKLFTGSAVVSPYKKDREMARRLHQEAGLPILWVFVNNSMDECEKSGIKGMYKKARAGKGFTSLMKLLTILML